MSDSTNVLLMSAAAKSGIVDLIKNLITTKGVPIDIKDVFGMMPIHHAACGGKPEALEFFISSGVDVDVADRSGRTPLFYAAMNGQLEALDFLLKKGADINIKSNSGKTILDECHPAALEFLSGFLKAKLESASLDDLIENDDKHKGLEF